MSQVEQAAEVAAIAKGHTCNPSKESGHLSELVLHVIQLCPRRRSRRCWSRYAAAEHWRSEGGIRYAGDLGRFDHRFGAIECAVAQSHSPPRQPQHIRNRGLRAIALRGLRDVPRRLDVIASPQFRSLIIVKIGVAHADKSRSNANEGGGFGPHPPSRSRAARAPIILSVVGAFASSRRLVTCSANGSPHLISIGEPGRFP